MSKVVAIAAGQSHSLALVSLNNGGTVWAWGLNSDGQLGNGASANQNAPVQVADPGDPTGYLQNVIAISAGDTHSLALKKDGSLFAWGFNGDGELGINSGVDSNVAIQVSNFTAARLLINGQGHIGGIPGKGLTGDILAVAFSPVDSIDQPTLPLGTLPSPTMVATASADYTARVWQWNRTPINSVTPRTDTNLVTLAAKLDDSVVNPAIPGTGSGAHAHTGSVNGVVFSPDGNYVFTVSTDASMKAWCANSNTTINNTPINAGAWLTDIADSSLAGEYMGKAHAGSITSIAATGFLNPNGPGVYPNTFYLVTGSVDRLAKLWLITVNNPATTSAPPVVVDSGSSTVTGITSNATTTAAITSVTETAGVFTINFDPTTLISPLALEFQSGDYVSANDGTNSIFGAIDIVNFDNNGDETGLVISISGIVTTGNPVNLKGVLVIDAAGSAFPEDPYTINVADSTSFPSGAWVYATDGTNSIFGQIDPTITPDGSNQLVLIGSGLLTTGNPANMTITATTPTISWSGPEWTIRDVADADNLVTLPPEGAPYPNSFYKTLLGSVNGVAIYNNPNTGNLEIYTAGADWASTDTGVNGYDTNIVPPQYFYWTKKWEYSLASPPGPAPYDFPGVPAKTFLGLDPGPVATPNAYGHTGAITSVSVSNDGSLLVTGSFDASAKVWNTSDGYPTDQPLYTCESAVTQPLTGHRRVVNSVAISPDDVYVATASEDGTVKRWNLTLAVGFSAQLDKTLYSTTAAATAVAFPTVFGTPIQINRNVGTLPFDLDNAYDVILVGGRSDPNYKPGQTAGTYPGQAQLLILPRVVTMSGGGFHSVAATEYGWVWAWGLDNNAQLGDNDNTYTDQLYPVQAISGLTSGVNVQYAPLNLIGNPNTTVPWSNIGPVTLSPAAVDFLVPGIQVAAGNDHSLALDNLNNVWAWGDDLYGECGDGFHNVSVIPHIPGPPNLSAIQVQTVLQNNIQNYFTVTAGSWFDAGYILIQVGAFANYTPGPSDYIYITSSGDNVVPGFYAVVGGGGGNGSPDGIFLATDITNDFADKLDGSITGYLNNVTQTIGPPLLPDPNAVPLGQIVAISAGWGYSLARDNQGVMWGWGHNDNGQLGNDDGEYERNMDSEGADQTYATEITLYRAMNHPDQVQTTPYDSTLWNTYLAGIGSAPFETTPGPVATPGNPATPYPSFYWATPPSLVSGAPGPPVWPALTTLPLPNTSPSLRQYSPADRWDAGFPAPAFFVPPANLLFAPQTPVVTPGGTWGGNSAMSSFSGRYWHSLGVVSPVRDILNWSVDPPRDPVTGLGAGGVVQKGNVIYNATDAVETPQSGVANEGVWTWNGPGNSLLADNSGTLTVDAGTTSYLRAIPNPGYVFDHWEGNFAGGPNAQGDTVQAWTTGTVAGNATVVAFFVAQTRQYQLTVTAVGVNGAPLPQAGVVTGGGSYNANSEVVVSARAATGYQFLYWLGDPDINNTQGTQDIYGTGSYNTRVIMTQSWNIQAVFGINKYSLTLLSNPANASKPTGAGTYPYGTTVTIDAPLTSSNWTFKTWTVTSGVGTVASNNVAGDPSLAHIILLGDTTLTANFSQLFTINVVIPEGAVAGSVNNQTPTYTTTVVPIPNSSPPAFPNVTLTAASSGSPWVFVSWTGDVPSGTVTGSPLTLLGSFISTFASGTLNIQANFSNGVPSLAVGSSPVTGVAISSASGQVGNTPYVTSVTHNTLVSLTAPTTYPPPPPVLTAAYYATANYFQYWISNGVEKPPGMSTLGFSMPSSENAVAIYALDTIPPTVTGMSPAPGSIQNAPDTVIQLQVTDTESGVDYTKVTISVEGSVIYDGANETAADSGIYDSRAVATQAVRGICYRNPVIPATSPNFNLPQSYSFYFEPTTVFYNEQLAHVLVTATDRAGNVMTPAAYAFTVQMRIFGKNAQVNTDSGGAQHRPATLADPSGNLWMVWDNGSQIWVGESPYVAANQENAYAFGTSTAVSTSGGTKGAAAIALAPSGIFYVVWQQTGAKGYPEIYGATSTNGTTWTPIANMPGVQGRAGLRRERLRRIRPLQWTARAKSTWHGRT